MHKKKKKKKVREHAHIHTLVSPNSPFGCSENAGNMIT
jgi:hypothetical protein